MLQRNKDGLYECAICHEVAYENVRALSSHIGKHHHIDAKTYYDTYVKKDCEENCPICGQPLKFRSLSDGYRETCSKKCAGQMLKLHPDRIAARQAKTEATCMEKYGTTNGGGTKEALDKAQQTNLARRGVRFAMQSKEVQELAKQTYLKEYGATTYLHSKDGEKAVAETNMKKFNRPNFFSGEEGNRAAREAYQAKHGYDHNMRDPKVIEKRKADEFAKHDGKYFVQTDKFKQKSKETQEAEYGTWYSASEIGKAKLREQTLAEHGVEYFFQSEQFKKSNEATLMAKYNVKNYSQTKEWNEKVHATSMRDYNVPHFLQSPVVKAKVEETCQKVYNVKNFAQSPLFIERTTHTSMERYNAPWYAQSDVYRDAHLKKYNEMLETYHCVGLSFSSFWEIRFKCNKCGCECTEQAQFIKFRTNAGMTPCTHCMPKNPPVSAEELAVKSYIENLGHVVSHYDCDFLGTYGADIVVEDCKTIVEYDGIYWHSELFHDSKYHLRKKMLAEEKGYRLVHIFSDEWTYKNDIVKSRLRYMFGMASVEKVYARDCTVRLVESAVSAEFLDSNHIQGNVNAPYRYGLYSGDKLVALMTFGSSRFEQGVTELLRFCSDRDINVVGGAGKLFSHFVKDHPEIKHIVSYADARWSTSHAFYEKLGFDFTAMSEPGYFIVDGDIRKSRMQFQRHKIAGPDDEGKTEHEITLERGLFRIYDCGQYRYDWKLESRPEKS